METKTGRLALMKLFGFALLFCSFNQMTAQSYITAIGARVGDNVGISLQQKILKKTTIEGIYFDGFRGDLRLANVIAERHFNIISRRLNFYLGAGLGKRWTESEMGPEFDTQNLLVPAIIGAEFTIGRINVSADIMPHYILEDIPEGQVFSNTSVSVRYVLIKDKRVKKDKLKGKVEDAFDKEERQKNSEKRKKKRSKKQKKKEKQKG